MKKQIKTEDLENYVETIKTESTYSIKMNLFIYDKQNNIKYNIFETDTKNEYNTYSIIVNWDNYETVYDNDYLCSTLEEVTQVITYFVDNSNLYILDYSNDLLNEKTEIIDEIKEEDAN